MAVVPAKVVAKAPAESRKLLLDEAANELVFAVVGHVGSGTSEIAEALQELLKAEGLPGGKFDAEILKARDTIQDWARTTGEQLPKTEPNDLATVTAFQDLGDKMRLTKGDNAAVARGLAVGVRALRAKKMGVKLEAGPIKPDGVRRAYILDSIRHPVEVDLLRHVYQEAFVLIGVVCEEKRRLERIVRKYRNAGAEDAKKFMKRDAKALEKHGQRVSDAFHLADLYVDNTVDRYSDNREPNPEWDINEELSRLIKILTSSEVVRPRMAETAMHHAYGAAMRSACMSRQVGASLADSEGNIVATGTNEVPKAGGGLYGETFIEGKTGAGDHRCVYVRPDSARVCSNNVQQNKIIDELINEIPELAAVSAARKNELRIELRNGRIGDLLEFSRAVHAEMDAILSAGRTGVSTTGTRLFVTTFPCHYCARGILTAGVDEVQYIEPYPKSQALELHADAITDVGKDWKPPSMGGAKVLFRHFRGIAPRMYHRAFLKDRDLKSAVTGIHLIGEPNWTTPWHLRRSSYVELEAVLAKAI